MTPRDAFILCAVLLVLGLGIWAVTALLLQHRSAMTASGVSYNGTAPPGDHWTIRKTDSALHLTNHTAGFTEEVRYRKEADDSYTILTPEGTPHTHHIRFIELERYMFVLHTRKAGPGADQEAIVIGILSEDLRITMTDAPHLFYQFQRRAGGGGAGFVTFLRGSNVSTDPAHRAPSSTPGDSARTKGRVQPGSIQPLWYNDRGQTEASAGVHTYNDTGENGGGPMAIDFKPSIDTPGPYMRMTEYDGEGNSRGTTTIFGTQSGHFVVDTPDSSILCFDSRKTQATLSDATYTFLYEGKADAVTSWSGNNTDGYTETETGDIQVGKGTATLANGTISIDTGTEGPLRETLAVTPFASSSMAAAFGDTGAMHPVPSTRGLFVAESGTRRTEGRTQLFFSVLDNTLLLHGFKLGAAGTAGTSDHYAYLYGAGIRDV